MAWSSAGLGNVQARGSRILGTAPDALAFTEFAASRPRSSAEGAES